MQAKIYRKILIGVIILVIITTIVAIYYQSVFSLNGIDEVASPYEYEYILKSVDNELLVLSNDESIVIRRLDVFLDSLPIADRMELEHGIKLKDEEALTKAIEDFES